MALEALLLADLEALIEEGLGEPARLAQPVRVVTASQALTEHLSAALLRRRGHSVLGVRIRTLDGLAGEIVDGSDTALPAADDAIFAVAIRQAAREEPALRERLDALVDGYRVVEATVVDLLDSGFEPAHADGVDAAFAAQASGGEFDERARAVLRVAVRLAEQVAAGRLGHGSQRLRCARERLEADPASVLPSRAVLIHGFADATGVQTDLIEALVRHCGARLYLDRPPDPAEPSRDDVGVAFSDRFAGRFGGVEDSGPGEKPPAIEVLHAPGPHAEVRAVAERLRTLLDSGALPERVAVVARNLHGYRVPLRQHFGRLGIPFSAPREAGTRGPAERRLADLLLALRRGERMPAERWLDAVDWEHAAQRTLSPLERADLRLLLHARGAARVGDVAALTTAEEGARDDDLRLPIRQGLWVPEDGGPPRAPHRRLPRALLDGAIDAARSLCAGLAAAKPHAPLASHLAWLHALVERDLGWHVGQPARDALDRALKQPTGAWPDHELDAEEFALFLERRFERLSGARLGGKGAGVQVLSAMDARARGFDRLFLLGLNRDLFPRTITEDPLLSDPVRQRLRVVLPDLPVKRDGYDEERFLFAELLASSPEVTLSCAVSDDEGKARPVSPLLERLGRAEHVPKALGVASLHGSRALDVAPAALRTAQEYALLAGLHGSREQFAALLAPALEEAWNDVGERWDARRSEAVARGRLAVLSEIDAATSRRNVLGPYYGFVGPASEAADPRRAPLYVTTAEAIVGCPWQAFLGRLLRLEMPPDALDALPAFEPLWIGSLVHGVLERIVAEATGHEGGSLEEALARSPASVPWPDDASLERLLRSGAEALLREAGVGLPGFARVLARHARNRLEVARETGWPASSDASGVLGAEVNGALVVTDRAGEAREVRFRADRVDRRDGELYLVDYKTGRTLSDGKRASTRAHALHKQVAAGRLLQSVAYALAGRAAGSEGATGAYLYLDPDVPKDMREFASPAADADFEREFRDAVGAVLEVSDRGSFFPRLLEPDGESEPGRCQYCEVKEACLRGDTGARARLRAWTAAATERPAEELSDAERALLRLWKPGGENA